MLTLSKVEQYTREHLKHNVIVNLVDGGFFGGALGFASFVTILPLFVASMTDSATLIGMVPAIHTAGWLLPQLFTAGYISRLRQYKRTVLLMTIHERVPFLGLAVIAFLLPKIGLQAGLILTFILLTWQGLGGGVAANAWINMISKIIPSDARGTFFGLQASVANLFISAGAVGAGYLLDWYDAPLNFVYCFIIAVILFTFSWFALAMNREPYDMEKKIELFHPPLWQETKRIISQDINFNWFLVIRVVSQFATMGFSFYIVYALRQFQMDTITAGYLTASLTISQTIASAGMGWLGDKFGHRSMLILGGVAATVSSALAWFAPSLGWFYPIFILTGFANVSMWTNSMTMSTSFSSEAERPMYIGLAQTIVAPAAIIAPIIGGWIADSAGFLPTFFISTILSIIMILILIFLLKDPHNFKQQISQPAAENI